MTRVLVIGLDGVPLDLITPWVEAGRLPNLARLINTGTVAPLNSTIPHTSAPAWTAFMTGKNPGKTDIYDFLYRQPATYRFPPNNAHMRDGQAIWQILSDHGKRVTVMNVPLTYPVDKINGVMLSGWMTPYQAQDFAHPPHILEELEKAVGSYTIYPLSTFSEKKAEAYFAACHTLVEKRTEAALYLMQRERWDFFMVVYFDTDRIMHQLWHYLDPEHGWRKEDRHLDRSGPIRTYFEHLDANVGKILAQADDETLVIVMSDHGMGRADSMISLNTWLLQQGWLKLKQNPLSLAKKMLFQGGFTIRNVHRFVDRLGLARHAEYKVMYSADRLLKKLFLSFDDVDWSQSRAYSFGRSVGPIYLNVQGREPHGIVAPGAEYRRLRDQLAEQVRQMRHPRTGEPLVGRTLFREDIYHGPHLEHAPDLILMPHDEANKFYGLSDFGANQVVLPMYRYSGMHRQHGLVILNGQAIAPQAAIQDAQITDLAPTILYALDLPVPADMDGRPLVEAFTPAAGARPVTYGREEMGAAGKQGRNGYSEGEARQVEQRLRQLGYLG